MTILRRTCIGFATILIACAGIAHAQQGPKIAPESLTDEQVVSAVNRGIDLLLKNLDDKLKSVKKAADVDRGKPETLTVADPGEYMLETYALLHAGLELHDPRLNLRDPRMQLLKDVVIHWDPPPTFVHDTYATALQALALSQMPRLPEVNAAMNHAASRLIKGMVDKRGYGYHLTGEIDIQATDQSNGQYALLGVWAAADWGATIPGNYWKQTDEYWRGIQTASGGWAYGGRTAVPPKEDTPSPSMTTAGVASLLVCSEFLDRTPHLDMRVDSAIQNGLAALTDKFDPNSMDLYYLYGVERVGLASGLKYIGKTNWYRAAAANLLSLQDKDGSFVAEFNGAAPDLSTCYAILLLLRGRAPIIMNKLQYDGPWNARPRDSANVHAYLTRIFERRLNWQVVPLDVSAEEWMDAPILFITGSQNPHFTDDQVDKLRTYVQQGGMIFSVANGGSKPFSDAMAAYAARIAPPGAGPWRELPADHPLFSVIGRPDPLPKLKGISNGVRELWIHSDTDYGAVWQSRNETDKNVWELPARLFMYVAGKNGLHSKLQPLNIAAPAIRPTKTVTMARLAFDGNFDPEPGAWPRMGKLLALQSKTALSLETVPIADLASKSPKPTLAHLAGLGKLQLTEAQEKSLQSYVTEGGTLFVEAIAGDSAFADSAKDLLAKLFPDAKLKAVPSDYLLYSGTFSKNAAPITEVEYRKNWVLVHGQQTKPRLQYMTINGRVGVIFFEEDITHGLLGMNTWGISGYAPDSSIALARNILLFADINTKK